MSLNHFSSSSEQPSSFAMYQSYQHHPSWLGSQIAQQPPTLSFNLNQQHCDATANGEFQHHQMDIGDEKETMFEKPLTPSDVGKLNRLVIPKQHAEKYFPLGGGGGGGDTGGEKGLLLSFEDESGKCWRFRYSYWNSSQSYVLTKGWSRYVKEKRLDAGDVVLFERHRNDSERLFIGWRRRDSSGGGGANNNNTNTSTTSSSAQVIGGGGGAEGGGNSSNRGWTRMFYSAPQSYPAHSHHHHSAPYPPDYLQHAAVTAGSPVQNQTVSSSGGSSKILRLFGVNLECQEQQGDESEPSTPNGSSISSQGPNQQQFYPNNAYYGDHRDFTFSRDANPPMRNRRG